jgi:hypothetical protein
MTTPSETPSPLVPLIPVEERTLLFYGDNLVAFEVLEGEQPKVYVPLKLINDHLGLSWAGQFERVKRDPVLSEVVQGIRVTRTATEGGSQTMLALPIEYLNGWLFGVNANRLKAELREKVIRYQRECYLALFEAFHPKERMATIQRSVDESHLLAMRDLARQQAELARQQVNLWDAFIGEKRRLDAVQDLAEEHDGMIRELSIQVDDLQERLSTVQRDLTNRITSLNQRALQVPPAPVTKITPAQKAAIKALVDDLVATAQQKGIRLGQGRNDYPAVWDAFKRRFDLAKYDELSEAQFDVAIQWLKEWLYRL